MKKTIIVLLLVLFVIGGSTAFAQDTKAAPKWTLELLGGAGYNYYSAMAVVDALKGNPRLRVSATQTTGPEMNVMESTKKDPNSCFFYSTQSSVVHAKLSAADFKGKPPITDLRWICGTMWGHHAFVVTDPNIKKMEDLHRKTLAALPGKSNLTKLEWSFELLGIKPKIRKMGFNEQYDALRDGVADAAMYLLTGIPGEKFFPVPALMELSQVKKLYAVPWPKRCVEYMNKKILETEKVPPTSFPTIIPAGSLPLQTEPIEAYGAMVNAYFAKAAASEEMVYEITKTLAENCHKLGAMLPDLKSLTPTLMIQLMIIDNESEIHPGALKYYKEVGLWPKAWKERKIFLK